MIISPESHLDIFTEAVFSGAKKPAGKPGEVTHTHMQKHRSTRMQLSQENSK